MNSKTTLLSSAILAVGMIVLGLTIRSGIITFKDRDRTVSAKGLAERNVMADKVTWPLIYKELSDDPNNMYQTLERKNKLIVDFLKKGGMKDSEICVNPPTITDRQADSYGNEMMNYRYKATSVITVTSNDVEKVRKLISRQAELMRQGIAVVTEEYGYNKISYEFTGLNKIKPLMVEEATKNARATAQKFAEDCGSSLGVIRSAHQGQVTIEDCDATTPHIKNVRMVTSIEYNLE